MPEPVAPFRARILLRRELGFRLFFFVMALELELLVLFLLDLHLGEEGAVSFSAGCWFAAISSVSIPASASIWCRRSSVPDARRGGLSERTRSRPSISP